MRVRFGLSFAFLWVITLLVLCVTAVAMPRIKDIADVGSKGDVKLLGYGLIVGLDGTGDSKGTEFTVQSVVNMLSRMGITVPVQKVRTKNVAAVIVSASLPASARVGTRLDATVSSLGDAKSLEGGMLLLTPLAGSDGRVYARAQGAVSVGGFKAGGGGGDMVSQNYTLVGRVPAGATVELGAHGDEVSMDYVDIALFNPDYTTAARVADAVRANLAGAEITPLDPGLVRIEIPDEVKTANAIVAFIAMVETTRVSPDVGAIVVINERTGTIVAGGNVTLGAVAIAHGNLSIEIKSRPFISQPAPFSRGETTVVPDTQVEVDVQANRLVALEESANVADVARALNALGVGPRDTVAIFQALREAGALRADIRII